jgi:copper resistance protein D
VAALLDIFAFLAVLLRALTLAFEALTVGGVIFLLALAPRDSEPALRDRLAKFLICSAALLAAAQVGSVALNSAVLMASTNLTWAEVRGASFCIAAALMIAGALLVGLCVRTRMDRVLCPVGCILILCGGVMTSHSMGRIEHRWLLVILTLTHHLATAAWIGSLPYLLLWLRRETRTDLAASITGRFSQMAMVSVPLLVCAGATMSLLYIGSVAALTGTAYGIMVLSKAVLTGLALALGGLNRNILQALRAGIGEGLLRLRRFGEAEVGIGITIILAAASLTSSPPAIDVQSDRVHGAEIAARMTPRWPRMRTPSVHELSPVILLESASRSVRTLSFVPGQRNSSVSAADIAWSEYNHHWSGLVVLAIGVLSLFARRMQWARVWPLAFLGLALFLFVRADAENWPLGPRGFWSSFLVAEVAQHRFFVLLIVAFAVFEWRVQSARVRVDRAGLVFPMVCAVGGTLLLTHSHSLGNVREEFLAELSHVPLAILAVMAGWSRWLEVRLKPDPAQLALRFMPWIWSTCFLLIGAILINYREA